MESIPPHLVLSPRLRRCCSSTPTGGSRPRLCRRRQAANRPRGCRRAPAAPCCPSDVRYPAWAEPSWAATKLASCTQLIQLTMPSAASTKTRNFLELAAGDDTASHRQLIHCSEGLPGGSIHLSRQEHVGTPRQGEHDDELRLVGWHSGNADQRIPTPPTTGRFPPPAPVAVA
jgi:hypothetical protein